MSVAANTDFRQMHERDIAAALVDRISPFLRHFIKNAPLIRKRRWRPFSDTLINWLIILVNIGVQK
jgi:hypothetical protein